MITELEAKGMPTNKLITTLATLYVKAFYVWSDNQQEEIKAFNIVANELKNRDLLTIADIKDLRR